VDAEGLAQYFGLKGGKRSTYKLIEQYDIPHIRVGRRLRFDVDQVRRFFEEIGVAPQSR
jgi:excisionase family DNA binding protein